MEILQKIIDEIDAQILGYEDQKGNYWNGAIAGLAQAKLIIRRRIIEIEKQKQVVNVVDGMGVE